jgi:flagellar biosynthesis/type III secretory pathway chaperone
MDAEQHTPGIINAIDDPLKRIHSVGTRLNPDENAELETLAAGRHVTPGELLRTLVKEETQRLSKTQEPSHELVEIVGLRLMLTNLLRPLAQGKTQTKEEIDVLTNTIRERKKTLAQEIIDGTKG